MGIKKGTKLTEAPKDYTIKIRMDRETNRRLEEMSFEKGVSKAEIIRRGIDLQYEQKTKE